MRKDGAGAYGGAPACGLSEDMVDVLEELDKLAVELGQGHGGDVLD
jgi:hypothetical protein